MTDETRRLDAAAAWYREGQLGFDRRLVAFRHRAIRPWLGSGHGLELGSAEGLMTLPLLDDFETLTIVDGAAELLAQVPDHPRLRKIRCLFEDFVPEAPFDAVVMDHVLEHVADPRAMLERARGWMRPGARLVAGVPNAWSFHRLAAVHMRLLATPTELNDRDREVGHRRVYTPETLRAEASAAGLRIVHEGGVFLKPLSAAQIDAHWSEAMLEGFYRLGLDFPRNAAEIFVVCE